MATMTNLRVCSDYCTTRLEDDLKPCSTDDSFDRAFRGSVRRLKEFCEWAIGNSYDLKTALQNAECWIGPLGDAKTAMRKCTVSEIQSGEWDPWVLLAQSNVMSLKTSG